MKTVSALAGGIIKRKNLYRELTWMVIMAALLLMGNLLTVRELFPLQGSLFMQMLAVILAGMLSCIAGKVLESRSRLSKLCVWIPWMLLVIWSGGFRIINVALDFCNVLITKWNESHRNSLALLVSGSAGSDLIYFMVFSFLLGGQLVFILITGRSKILGGFYCLFFFLLQLMVGVFTPFGSSCLIAGLLGLCMVEKGERIIRLKLAGLVFISLVLFVSAFAAPETELTAVSSFRKSTGEQIHNLRYGKQVLPQGDLGKASLLSPDQEEMLVVRTDQEKNLYLRGFVGEEYVNGIWQELPAAAYGGENSGLMKWLHANGFDPLTQTAAYYRLLDEEDRPEKNRIWIGTAAASRYYVYAPISAVDTSVRGFGRKKDHRLTSHNLTGSGFYEIEEISGSKPAEIMIADDFVMDPQTEEQKAYCEAESVYRKFVYEQYTAIDRQLYGVVDDLFFSDYDAENDSIYSVVSQVRKILKENVYYTEETEEVPEGEDPLLWFLTQSHRGNAVYYATAATAAFRAHGIPARYVEGYYISEDQIGASDDGTVTLTGKNAHAWVEIYFDGIGWQPVDVTPGYYFDAIALQQMVGMPDTVHKTAALQNDPHTAEQVTDLEGKVTEDLQEQILTVSRRLVMVLFGVVAALFLLATGFFLGAELMRYILLFREQRREEKEAAAAYVNRMKERIYHRLALWDIQAVFGLQKEKTDQEICDKIDTVKEGEYSRVCELMEKTIYGDIELTTYERRTLKTFVDKVSTAPESCGWKMRLRLRYADLMQ